MWIVPSASVDASRWSSGQARRGTISPVRQTARPAAVRAASLQPRRPDRYVRRFAWALGPATAVVAVATGAATAVADAAGWAEPHWWGAGGWLAGALAVFVAVRLIQQAVLRRPQPLAAPDLIEADDAIRSRALHVLAGGGAALALFLVLNQLGAVHPVDPHASDLIGLVRALGVFVVATLGWLVATSIWPPPGAAGRTDIPPTTATS